GRLFREFAITISVAILVSGFVSLSLTPMLCSRLLKAVKTTTEPHAGSRFWGWTETAYERLVGGYRWTLEIVLRHRALTVLISVALFAVTVVLFYVIPKGFIPNDDTSQIVGYTEAAEGISFSQMQRHQEEIVDIIRKNPNVAGVLSTVGLSDVSAASNTGNILMLLKPFNQRKADVDTVIEQLRPQLNQTPGIRIYLQNPPLVQVGGQVTKSPYQLTLQGPDRDELYKTARALQNKLSALPDLVDVTSDIQIENPQLNVQIDRDKASSVGISVQQIEDILNDAFGTRQISTIYATSNEYEVIVEVKPEYQRDASALGQLYIRPGASTPTNVPTVSQTAQTPSVSSVSANAATSSFAPPAGQPTPSPTSPTRLVPLSAIATLSNSLGPLLVNHVGQLPSATISFNLRPGASLSRATERVQELAKQTLPQSITFGFQGTAQVFQTSLQNLTLLLVVAVMVIYLVLGILYESFVHPLTILSGLPSAGLGALLILLLFGRELDVYAFVGLIMLIGIVEKNAIMMIDFALDAQRNEGKPAEEAIFQACLIRFRPIMMTTMAALMGTLPIALGWGAGATSRRGLGLAVVGGLTVSQVLTLYLTPVVYIYFELAQARFTTWLQKRKQTGEDLRPIKA
ncbi:MAG TPA: efflux RND transporter permease subunit, partial [Pyrinomonadaceae bacterium]|nr:efflux RND transporter permease subunit [Pyrinomonadaceae bacterium]